MKDVTLNEGQQKAFDLLMSLEPDNVDVPSVVFLTGKQGTGKSTIIQKFLNETDMKVATCAPSGLAADLINGYTVHRTFGIDCRPVLDCPAEDADIIIIDEVSMLRADLMDEIVNRIEHSGGGIPSLPLNGVKLVLVGDPRQLSPIVTRDEKEKFSRRYPEGPWFFQARCFRGKGALKMEKIILTECMRQKEGQFLSLLDSLGEGRGGAKRARIYGITGETSQGMGRCDLHKRSKRRGYETERHVSQATSWGCFSLSNEE